MMSLHPPFKSIAEDILPVQLDCIAFNPHHTDLLSIGSYEINPTDNGSRIGKIYLVILNSNSVNGYEMLQTLDGIPGVLDLKWKPSEEDVLGVATSESVLLYGLTATSEKLFKLSQLKCLSTNPDMALYLQWMDSINLLFSDSSGKVAIWNTTTNPEVTQDTEEEFNESEIPMMIGVQSATLHKFFVWFVHFDKELDVISSGDDCGFFRSFHRSHLQLPQYHWKHQFETGVTSILSRGDILAVGCYDDKLRIFRRTLDLDTLRLDYSPPLMEMNLGGTVWRTVWLPSFQNETEDVADVFRVGIAAGRNGIHFIKFNTSDKTWETTFSCLTYSGELAYGIDIIPNENNKLLTVATCYFDSHRLHVFSITP